MIMPSDKDYQQTKRLKIKDELPPSPFRELAAWIASRYDVEVLNVHYDTVIPDDRPRLNVILEWERDERTFFDGFNFDEDKQDCIRRKFEALLSERRWKRFKTDGLFVVFSAFEPVARIEANGKVTDRELKHLKRRLDNPELWTISRCFDGTTFFFYTDAQAEASEAKGLRDKYSDEYARLVEPYDQFGYLGMSGVRVSFDSKENFDKNFKSSWFNYYR